MRKLFSVLAAGALALAVAAPAMAAPVAVTGSLSITVGTLPSIVLPIPATSVDYNSVTNTITVPAGIASTSGLFVSVTGFPLNLITGILVTASNGAGSFAPGNGADGGAASIPGGGFGGKMSVLGVVQVKGALAINVPISVIGKGGVASAGGIVVEGAPWTTGVAKVTTTGAVMAMATGMGAPLGASSVTLVTPAHVNAAGLTRLATFAALTLNGNFVVPEPGTALLLGAGIAGLVALGRKKARD